MANNEKIIQILKEKFHNLRCKLNYSNCVELGIAGILSAQCTDKRVN